MEKIINKVMRIVRKKYFLIVFLFVCLIGLLGVTYSYWSAESGWKLASEIKFKELNYLMLIDNENSSQIISSANSGTVYYNVAITSLNEINTRYSLTYKSNRGGINVKISSISENDSNGIIGLYESGEGGEKTKNIRIAITNETIKNATIDLEVAGGYTWNSESEISLSEGFNRITEIQDESLKEIGLTLAEELNETMNCIPTVTAPCLLKENSTNYLTYSGHTWRIVGTYLINNEMVTKLILNEPLGSKITSENVNTELTTFYNTLDNSLIREGSPFACSLVGEGISCTGSGNIGSISDAEYSLIGGVNSYLYTKPNKEYWLNENFYAGTSRGITDSATLAFVRPSIYLKANTVIDSSNNYKSVSLTNLIYNSDFSEGTAGWGTENNTEIILAPRIFNGRTITFATITPSISAEFITQHLAVSVIGGHKFYSSALVTSSMKGDVITYGVFGQTKEATITTMNPNLIVQTIPSRISDIITTTSSVNSTSVHVNNSSTMANFGVGEPILIDLTEAFGEGNEPSLEWCDENISYSEGTQAVLTTIFNRNLGKINTPYTIAQGIQLIVNLNGGTSNIKNGYYVSGETYPITFLVKNGYSFDNWTINGTGTTANEDSVTIGTTASTLSANWKEVQVIFDVNGGDTWASSTCTGTGITLTESICSKIVPNSSEYGELPTPARSGYIFDGWYTTSSKGGIQITSSSIVTSDQTLYARWISTLKIVLNVNGGSAWTRATCTGTGITLTESICSKIVPIGSEYGELPTPARSGYIFRGWYTTSSTGGTLVTSSTIVTETADHTLYAQWGIQLQ